MGRLTSNSPEPCARFAPSKDASQTDVARKAGIRPERFARYERGEVRDPLLSTLVRLARGLDMSVADLIGID